MWSFFALVMLVFYTSYLCSVLSMDKVDAQITSVEDLVHQSTVQYGCVNGGSTMKFFENSESETYRRMFFAMKSAKPSVFTNSNDEGKVRVQKGKGKYAFLMESPAIEYVTERNCDLEQVGREFDQKGYGIAMPISKFWSSLILERENNSILFLDSRYRNAINQAVLALTEEGIVQRIKNQWWQAQEQCQKKPANSSEAEADSDYVVWFFVFLGGGCFVALIVAIVEYLFRILQK